MTSRGSRPGATLRSLGIIAVLVLPAILLAAVAVLLPRDPEQLRPDVQPVWASPTTGEQREVQQVVVRVEFGDPPRLLSPGGEQVVTDVAVAPGDPVRNGQAIATIGEAPLVAVRTPHPFSRDLQAGDRGPDVTMLQKFLHDSGQGGPSPDGTFGPSTADAVKDWRTSIGDPRATGVFELQETVWLPSTIDTVESVDLVVGAAPPPRGDAIIVGTPQSTAATVRTATTDQPVAETDGFGLWVADTDLGDIDGAALSRDQIEQVEDLARQGTVQPAPSDPGADGQTDGSASEDITQYPAELRGVKSERRVAVPGSAVVPDGAGGACVFVGDGEQLTSVNVEVVDGGLDVVYLDPASAPTDDVLVNPVDVPDVPPCG